MKALRADDCSSDEANSSPSGENPKQPRGLIKTFEANGIEASADGGWKCNEENSASQGLDQSPREGMPHICSVRCPRITERIERIRFQAWVGWFQLYVDAKVNQKQTAIERYIEAAPPKAGKAGVGRPTKRARGRPHQSGNG